MRLLSAPKMTMQRAATPTTRARTWPPAHRAQLPLLLASFGVIIGSFLPWVVTGFGTYHGVAGAGLWTFYAGIFGVAGGLIPSRRIARVHGVAVTAAAIALPVWQVARLLGAVRTEGWQPGFGLFVVVLGGLVTGVATVSMRPE